MIKQKRPNDKIRRSIVILAISLGVALLITKNVSEDEVVKSAYSISTFNNQLAGNDIILNNVSLTTKANASAKATNASCNMIQQSPLSFLPPMYRSTGTTHPLTYYVYFPQRLKVINHCITVTGIIREEQIIGDGDIHVHIKVDPKFQFIINAANIKYYHGWLVTEAICHPPHKCIDGFQSTLPIPPVGTHVKVTGPYVLDEGGGHFGWSEIHPIENMSAVPTMR